MGLRAVILALPILSGCASGLISGDSPVKATAAPKRPLNSTDSAAVLAFLDEITRLSTRPEVRSELQTAIAKGFLSIGNDSRAEAIFADIRKRQPRGREVLAEAEIVGCLAASGRIEKAIAALAKLEKMPTPGRSLRDAALGAKANVAGAVLRKGDTQRALSLIGGSQELLLLTYRKSGSSALNPKVEEIVSTASLEAILEIMRAATDHNELDLLLNAFSRVPSDSGWRRAFLRLNVLPALYRAGRAKEADDLVRAEGYERWLADANNMKWLFAKSPRLAVETVCSQSVDQFALEEILPLVENAKDEELVDLIYTSFPNSTMVKRGAYPVPGFLSRLYVQMGNESRIDEMLTAYRANPDDPKASVARDQASAAKAAFLGMKGDVEGAKQHFEWYDSDLAQRFGPKPEWTGPFRRQRVRWAFAAYTARAGRYDAAKQSFDGLWDPRWKMLVQFEGIETAVRNGKLSEAKQLFSQCLSTFKQGGTAIRQREGNTSGAREAVSELHGKYLMAGVLRVLSGLDGVPRYKPYMLWDLIK